MALFLSFCIEREKHLRIQPPGGTLKGNFNLAACVYHEDDDDDHVGEGADDGGYDDEHDDD